MFRQVFRIRMDLEIFPGSGIIALLQLILGLGILECVCNVGL